LCACFVSPLVLEMRGNPTPLPLISICIVYHNAASTIAQALRSLLDSAELSSALDLPDQWLEIVAIDNASSDHSAEALVDAWKAAGPGAGVFLSCAHELRQGVSHARNKALELSCGQYIAFLDADDCVDPAYFPLLLQGVAAGADLIHLELADLDFAESRPIHGVCLSIKELVARHLHGWWCCSFVARRSLYHQLRFVGECYEDVGLFPLVLSRADRCFHVFGAVYRYARSEGGLTSRSAAWRSCQWDAQFHHLRANEWQMKPLLSHLLSLHYVRQRIDLRAAAGFFPVVGLGDSCLYLRSSGSLVCLLRRGSLLLCRNAIASTRALRRFLCSTCTSFRLIA